MTHPLERTVNGDVSFWHRDMGGLPPMRSRLDRHVRADVCIIGAGYTGLWTAYYLKRSDPSLRIAIVEQRFAGYGGSGRNGGWLSGAFEWSRDRYLESSSRSNVQRMQAAMAGSVDEIIARTSEEGIDADILRCDKLLIASNPAQLERLRAYRLELSEWGVPAAGLNELDEAATRERIRLAHVTGGLAINGVARVQPAKLVRGLAAAVERGGVSIFENSRVVTISKGEVVTTEGRVSAPIIVKATEGFSAGLQGGLRQWLPLNSALLVTEPLNPGLWREIGWNGGEILGDFAHAYFYAQRTREGRIAFGGRGIPYRFGSALDRDGKTQQATMRQLRRGLVRQFPMLRDVKIDHAWCGVLGVPRDWCATVGLDRETGIAWAGGYVGLGVSTSNVAGRTLCDLILERESELTGLPWVNRRTRQWEPEPFRWLAVQSLYAMYRASDWIETTGQGRTSRLAKLADAIAGH